MRLYIGQGSKISVKAAKWVLIGLDHVVKSKNEMVLD